MKRLTKEDIEAINNRLYDVFDEDDQGIFFQPAGIPVKYAEHVVYSKYKLSGAEGGTCWGDHAHYVNYDAPYFEALKYALEKIEVDPQSQMYREIFNMTLTEEGGQDSGYYGNFMDFEIEYIPLETIYKYLCI